MKAWRNDFFLLIEVADPDAEDGEVLEEEDKIKYDLSKLIQFPGFNAPLPENSIDVGSSFGFVDIEVFELH